MISDKCPICGTDLRLFKESFQLTYECPKEIIPRHGHYGFAFSNEDRLIFEYFWFEFNREKIGVRVDFENKKSEISHIFARSRIKVPYYLGPGNLDKIKNYIILA